MRVVLQRTKEASVSVDGQITGKINNGFVVLVGFCNNDDNHIVEKLVKKIISLRVFSDQDDKMNLELKDTGGSILSISQFTLYADCKKGKRPSFIEAAKPDLAIPLYEYFNKTIESYGIEVQKGIFGADMKVELLNDGPVTIILDSEHL